MLEAAIATVARAFILVFLVSANLVPARGHPGAFGRVGINSVRDTQRVRGLIFFPNDPNSRHAKVMRWKHLAIARGPTRADRLIEDDLTYGL